MIVGCRVSVANIVIAACFCAGGGITRAEELSRDGVVVAYSDIDDEHAEAIARTVSAARAAASEQFGFDMPETITVTVQADPSAKVRLFNDGHDRFSLTIRSQDDLRRPQVSGTFHLYGLCHEVGHLAMYRPIQQRRWMTTAAAEGWAHYLGSRLTDEVYAREGADLWPDRYDYRADGMARLKKQLADRADEVGNGARLWMELAEIVGDRGIAPLFRRWGQIDVDPAAPAEPLGAALAEVSRHRQLPSWWNKAQEHLVVARPKSGFTVEKAEAGQVEGVAQELAHDDGTAGGKQSIAGGGHAVRFEAAGGAAYLTGVRVHGGRYGRSQAPDEDFHVWLCDKDFKEIAAFPFPYASFHYGTPKWVSLRIEPTRVPAEFYVCVGFNPTATKGVFVSHDGQASERSVSGLPGGRPRPYPKGTWMIRAQVVQQSTMRTWTDTTGSFSIEAELVDSADGKVRLKKKDGRVVTVPLAKLSSADRRFVASQGADAKPAPPKDAPPAAVVGKEQELKRDDGTPAGKRSLPRGFAVALEAPSESCELIEVRIHGARYGLPQPPQEDFHVTLCNEDFEPIADFPFPYAKFRRGAVGWVALPIDPTEVPAKFVLCLNFNPTAQKGVFVSHDAEGAALVGLPNKPAGRFTGGDWLIRAKVRETP